ncbi:sensor histidine kinase [Actimicrobium sp. GrIS 1.19]|uniref:sensor histidine kinase n=1 Tax=Actimicrobium sp. GrIS 1.19 TaxID=3071708 RepID=UPI002E100ABC
MSTLRSDAADGMLARFSFRQLLFAGFILISLVLTASSVQALLALEHLTRLGRETAARAVMLSEQSQLLTERTLAMERSARQFMVLDELVFRERYRSAWEQGRAALALLAAERSPELAGEWTRRADAVWSVLQTGKRRGRAGQTVLDQTFARLPVINEQMAAQSKRETAQRNSAMLDELERQRQWLAALLFGGVVLSAILASWFGTWLSRPLRRIEQAIGRLGENRFDQIVTVDGPADTRRLGQQLDWLRQRLAALDDDQKRFARHISHELKTPLAALREGVALLEDEVAGPLTAGQREIAGILRQNSAALQSQIEDLLRYNAAAWDAQRLQRVEVDLLALLHKVVDEQRLQWQARRLQVSVEGDPVRLLADADKLGVALANILSNAVRFSPEGARIVLRANAGTGVVVIDCIDQGPGVAADDARRIFEPFFQGSRHPAGARTGNGIGLSIVREYVGAHQGSVQLIPRSQGAHFRIELPNEK